MVLLRNRWQGAVCPHAVPKDFCCPVVGNTFREDDASAGCLPTTPSPPSGTAPGHSLRIWATGADVAHCYIPWDGHKA